MGFWTPKKIVFCAVAVCGAVAVTALVVYLVGPAIATALGFSAGGIVVGSPAAFLMSLGGGLTPAFVSILLSIGATGAVPVAIFELLISFGFGALVGVLIAALAANPDEAKNHKW